MSALFVYITCAHAEEAKQISEHLVQNRLAACVNIFPAHRSVYWWEGQVQQAEEIALIAKTTPEMFSALEQAVIKLHSYACPCIVALPIEKGHKPFLEWIKAETE